jgi:hypothetical protein
LVEVEYFKVVLDLGNFREIDAKIASLVFIPYETVGVEGLGLVGGFEAVVNYFLLVNKP